MRLQRGQDDVNAKSQTNEKVFNKYFNVKLPIQHFKFLFIAKYL